jgi:hypothetical protein
MNPALAADYLQHARSVAMTSGALSDHNLQYTPEAGGRF